MGSLFRKPISELSGVGPRREQAFHRLGVRSVGELLRFYPRTYEDWSTPIALSEAPIGQPCCLRAQVIARHSPVRLRGGMTLLKCEALVNEVPLQMTFFNQTYLFDKLNEGEEFLLYGTVKRVGGQYEITAPAVLSPEEQRIHPIYPQTNGLSSRVIEATVEKALSLLPETVRDPLPESLRREEELCSLEEAIRQIHFPKDMQAAQKARERLAFEELLTLQLAMARLKGLRSTQASHPIAKDYTPEFLTLLPFQPTKAQQRAIRACVQDMQQSTCPMNRLIQGDVGSGKTAVAAAVCFTAVRNGLQCALMAPTEILAEQHYHTFCRLLQDTGVQVGLLTGSTKAAEKKKMKQALAEGTIDLIIGTHALLSENVSFRNLGLVITDEQHRFGVAQRSALIEKGQSPHILVMSATPIPRTLALMVFGDLDLSVLDELPPGRQKVNTYLIDSAKRPRLFRFAEQQIQKGRQCYIVCPLVSQTDSEVEMESAKEYLQKLKETNLASYATGLLHGKMKPKEKEAVMRAFSQGELDLLVSTTVIEVGVDVPNATLMIIENAERFGLSQLHQLRGRVGRGQSQSYCVLISDNTGETSQERLQAMCRTNDGFKIADEDLRLRGPGDFFGSRQSGLPEMKIAGLSDMAVIDRTQRAAREILQTDPTLSLAEHHGLKAEISRLMEGFTSG